MLLSPVQPDVLTPRPVDQGGFGRRDFMITLFVLRKIFLRLHGTSSRIRFEPASSHLQERIHIGTQCGCENPSPGSPAWRAPTERRVARDAKSPARRAPTERRFARDAKSPAWRAPTAGSNSGLQQRGPTAGSNSAAQRFMLNGVEFIILSH